MVKEELLGADYGWEGGDKTCKVYGIIKRGKVIVTKIIYVSCSNGNRNTQR